jgi:UDP-N-acetylmuramoyl-L-alanyl-D-glutamate--2,6-diaminopimelate ligase
MHQPARLRAKDVHNSGHGLHFQVQEGEEVHSLHTDWVADFNVINVLGVLAAMRAIGVSLADAVQACRGLPAVPGRMQSMGGVDTPCVVVDYAHTPDALLQALKALRPMAKAREGDLHCVFGCGGNRDTSKRAPMAKVAEEFAHHLVFTSDNPRHEDPEQIIQNMVAGLSNTTKLTVCMDRAQAIAQTIAQAQPQDVILIAGKGHETYQEIGASRLSFSDVAHALTALKLRGGA